MIAKRYELKKVYLHCFMDGRDTDPRSGLGFISQVQEHCAKSAGVIASIVGRFYAMDRDHRWDRVKVAYDLLVDGKGEQATDMVAAMQQSYDNDVTDEFIKPINNSTVDGTIKPDDCVVFFNYRNDRAKELTEVLTQKDMPEDDNHLVAVSLGSFHGVTKTVVESFHSLLNGRIYAGVSHHVAVGIVYNDEVVLLGVDCAEGAAVCFGV